MTSISVSETGAGMPPEQGVEAQARHSDFLYQAAIVLAILVCLINF